MYSSEELKIILPSGHLYKGTNRWVLFLTLKANRPDAPLIAWVRRCLWPWLSPKDTLIFTVTTLKFDTSNKAKTTFIQ